MLAKFFVERKNILPHMLFPIGSCLAALGIFLFGADIRHIWSRVIFITLMFTTICVACLETKPRGETRCYGCVGCGVVIPRVCLSEIIVSHDVAVVGQAVEISKSISIFVFSIIHRHKR